jgi:putative nucleotidyltransferase with HDIG domain
MRQGVPELIMIDQNVPMGAIRTASILRLHPDYQQVPILLTIADDEKRVEELMEKGKKINLQAYIRKPCTSAELEAGIREHLQVKLPRIALQDIRAELAHLTQLPVLSPAHQQMMKLLAQEDAAVDIPAVVRTMESDQGLSTAVMRMCRSAYYGFRGNTISSAIVFLGVEKVRSIVQATIVFDIFADQDDRSVLNGFSMLKLWQHCVACGIIMEMAGGHIKGRDHFLAGMLHDIGKVILYFRFPEYFAEILRIADEEHKSIYQAERALLGITHAEIGAQLARKWDLPPTLSTSIAFHHHPSAAPQHRRLTSLVHVSDITARQLGIGYGGDNQQIKMDPYAQRIARYTAHIAEKKGEIIAQLESLIPSMRQGH